MICSVCVSTMYTVVLLVEMNNRVPSGETRTTNGFPAGVKIVDTCWDEATSITPTFWSHWLVTYAVPPSGEKATPVGQLPVGMNPSRVRVCVLVMPTPALYASLKYVSPS